MILKIMGVVKGSTSTITIAASEIIVCGFWLECQRQWLQEIFYYMEKLLLC